MAGVALGAFAAHALKSRLSAEMLAVFETGVVGFALIVGFCAGILLLGAWRSLRAPPEPRVAIAAATAACAAFIAGASVDWVWELGVMPMTFLALAAIVCVGGDDLPSRLRREPAWWPLTRRIGLIALSVAGLIAIVPPLVGAVKLENSYEAEAEGRLADALDDARGAISAQPYATSPRLQEARLLARRGKLDDAIAAAREATEREPANWRNWLALATLEKRAGHRGAATVARRRIRELNPNALIFADSNASAAGGPTWLVPGLQAAADPSWLWRDGRALSNNFEAAHTALQLAAPQSEQLGKRKEPEAFDA